MPKLDLGQWIFLSVCVVAITVGFLVGKEAIGGAIVAAIIGFIGSFKGGQKAGRLKEAKQCQNRYTLIGPMNK